MKRVVLTRWLLGGLQTRIGLALGAVLVLFIVLTEVTVSRLTGVSVARQAAAARGDGDQATAPPVSAELTNLRRLVLFYLIAGTALVLFISGLTLNRLVIRPLKQLNEALDRVASGRLDTVIPVGGSGELATIGAAFNRMTRELSLQRQELAVRLGAITAANEELAETQERLVRAGRLASVGTLAAGVAHEIGNPLAGILGLVEALERGERENEERYLALMKQELSRIDRIISKLLSFARAPRSEMPQVASVGEVMDRIRPLLKAQRAFDGVAIREVVDASDRVGIGADDLQQILLNLLLNAAEAMAGQGEVAVETEAVADLKNKDGVSIPSLRIHVTDTGRGLGSADGARIFDPFYTRKASGSGTGLGLSICHTLCDQVGGEIILDTVYRGGTRFTVTLPRVL